MIEVRENKALLLGAIEDEVEEERSMSLRMWVDLGMVIVGV